MSMSTSQVRVRAGASLGCLLAAAALIGGCDRRQPVPEETSPQQSSPPVAEPMPGPASDPASTPFQPPSAASGQR